MKTAIFPKGRNNRCNKKYWFLRTTVCHVQVKVVSDSFQSFSALTPVHEHVNYAVLMGGGINLIVVVHIACSQLTIIIFLYLGTALCKFTYHKLLFLSFFPVGIFMI